MQYTKMTVELNGLQKHEYVTVKQGDIESRALMVSLMDNGRVYLLTDNHKVMLMLTKPDGKEVLEECSIENNKVIAKLTEQMLIVAGEAKGELIIIDRKTSAILKSATIVFLILPSEFYNSDIVSSNEYTILLQKIQEIENYKQEMGEYITASDDINIDDLPSSGDTGGNSGTNNIYTEEQISGETQTIKLKNKTFFKVTDTISNITIEDPENMDVNFYCCLFFKTGIFGNNIGTKSIQKTNIKFMGEDCKNGVLYYKTQKMYLIEFKYAGTVLFADVIGYSVAEDEGDDDSKDDNNKGDNGLLADFSGADELIEVAMTYQKVRDDYLTYGQTNIMTSNGSKSWEEVTTLWNGIYLRHLDCSAGVGLWLRGIPFEEVLASKAVYNAKDLSARTDKYPWAFEVRRTAAQIYEDLLALGYILPTEQIHGETEQWAGLKKGDIIFQGGKNNGRTLGIYHVMVYYGLNSQNKNCVIEVTSGATRKHKYSNGTESKYNVGCQVIQFAKKNLNDIVAVARIQK